MQDILLNAIDWQAADTYTTNRGKDKEIITGIPTDPFWKLWKREKDAIKQLGVTLKCERTPTGKTKTHKGICREVVVKRWEVILWVRPTNARLACQIVDKLKENSNEPF
jgi:hypothetical protein